MLDKPQIVQANAQTTAIIRLTIPRAEIRNVMGPGCSGHRADRAVARRLAG